MGALERFNKIIAAYLKIMKLKTQISFIRIFAEFRCSPRSHCFNEANDKIVRCKKLLITYAIVIMMAIFLFTRAHNKKHESVLPKVEIIMNKNTAGSHLYSSSSFYKLSNHAEARGRKNYSKIYPLENAYVMLH